MFKKPNILYDFAYDSNPLEGDFKENKCLLEVSGANSKTLKVTKQGNRLTFTWPFNGKQYSIFCSYPTDLVPLSVEVVDGVASIEFGFSSDEIPVR
jgi:hypothetical protein